jgi:3-phenylpropionate/trans-cinnamate dioxygenase ferredoxin reductase component
MTGKQTVAIAGGGQAGFQAAASLRELGFAGAIAIYGEEPYLPYQRPPLSKTYLKEAADPSRLYLRAANFYADKQIEMVTGARVVAIDRGARALTLADGRRAAFDHLVLATGVTNRRLTGEGMDLAGVVTLRGIDDAEAIRRLLASANRLLIIGGGVIGLEVSALARGLGLEVDIVEVGDRLAGRIGTAELSEHFLRFHRGLGANVHHGTSVTRLEGREGRVVGALLSNGARIESGLVLVCVGVTPNTALAEAAGLTVRDGIVVDENMRTSDHAIFAIGDCARFRPPHGLMESVRLESVPNAIDQGKCAAEMIVGRPRAFDALPWFWSDQGAMKVQIAGLVQGYDRTIVKADATKADAAKGGAAKGGAMTVFCFADDQLIGVECINRPADFMAARRVLTARKVVRPADVAADGFELKRFMGT